MEKYTIAIVVRNKSGVLNRVTSVFRRFGVNISNLTAAEDEGADYSKITVLFDGDERSKRQLINQINKLPDVLSIN